LITASEGDGLAAGEVNRYDEIMTTIRVSFFSAVLAAGLCGFISGPGFAAEAPKGRILYDTKADGNEQIKAALEQAAKENKNVILKFGANWCGWCHKLSDLFKTNAEIGKALKENYVLVLIDVDKGHNADVVKKYGEPTKHGLPVLVVLDKSGKQLWTQDTAKLEEGDHHDPAKVMGFLTKWAPAKK
jgi:thioredoxin-related protein